MDPFMSMAEAAAAAPCSVTTIIQHRDFGSLVCIRFDNGRYGIRRSEFLRWKAERDRATAEVREGIEVRRQDTAARRERWLAEIAARHRLVRAE